MNKALNKDKNKDGGFLGILMLDTNFERILGDAGNTNSYSYEARTLVVKGAGSLDIVKDGLPAEHLVESFCEAAQKLESQGAKAIVSTCGFLISAQDRIASSVKIPVMVSSLSLYSQIIENHSVGKMGIITASQKSLGASALKSAGIVNREKVIIVGMEDCGVFNKAFLMKKEDQSLNLDKDTIEQAVVERSIQLINNNPKISSILLECGNLPPYAKAIEKATSRPVYSILNSADQMML